MEIRVWRKVQSNSLWQASTVTLRERDETHTFFLFITYWFSSLNNHPFIDSLHAPTQLSDWAIVSVVATSNTQVPTGTLCPKPARLDTLKVLSMRRAELENEKLDWTNLNNIVVDLSSLTLDCMDLSRFSSRFVVNVANRVHVTKSSKACNLITDSTCSSSELENISIMEPNNVLKWYLSQLWLFTWSNNEYNCIYLFVILRQFPHTENVVCTGNCPNVAIRVPPTANTTWHTSHRLRGKSHRTRAQFLHQIKRHNYEKSHELVISLNDYFLYTDLSACLEVYAQFWKYWCSKCPQFLTWILYGSVKMTKSNLKKAI